MNDHGRSTSSRPPNSTAARRRVGAWLDDLASDARLGLRQLAQRPGWTGAALLTLALGIGASAAVFGFADALLWRPFPFDQPERLVVLWETSEDQPQRWAAPGNFVDWQRELTTVESIAAHTRSRVVLGPSARSGSDAVAAHRLEAQIVTAGFFEVLGTTPSAGRFFAEEGEHIEGLPVAVLSHALWTARFGADPAAIGTAVRIDDAPHHVLGVAPAGFQLGAPSDVFLLGRDGIPARMRGFDGDVRQMRDAHFLDVVARLPEDVPVATAMARVRAEIGALAARLAVDHPETNAGLGATVQPLRESVVGDTGGPLLAAFGGGVLLLLVLATVNVAGLVLARGQGRRHELAVRSSLGAGRGRLVRQMVVENLVLTMLGGGLGLLLSGWLLELLDGLLPGGLQQGPNQVAVDGRVLLFGAVVTLVCGLLVGLWPALGASRRDPATDLGAGSQARSGAGRAAVRARSGLVVAQLAVAQVLLAVAALLVVSLLRLMDVDAGNAERDLLTFQVTLSPETYGDAGARNDYFRRLENSLVALPGVDAASAMLRPPLGGVAFNRGFSIEGRPEKSAADADSADQMVVGAEYFDTLGVQLLAGRPFDASDGADAEPVVIVDRALAERFWPGEDSVEQALGQRIAYGGRTVWRRIVGVSAHVRQRDLVSPPRPTIFAPFAQTTDPFPTMSFAVRGPVAASSLVAAVRSQTRSLDPGVPMAQVATFDELLTGALGFRRALAWLLAAFAGFALLLSAVGVYGVVSFQTVGRSKEMALRMALGSDRGGVLRLVLGQGMRLGALGIVLGLPAALAVSRLFESQLFEVERLAPGPYLLVALVLSTVAFVAVLLPARRAATLEPAGVLRDG